MGSGARRESVLGEGGLIGRLLVLLVVAYVVAAAWLFVVRHDDPPARADAVVVLAGSKQRLPVGRSLVHRRLAGLLVVSLSEPPTAAQTRACADRHPGYRVLCFHADPYSTRGEAREIARLAAERNWHSIDVVTSKFHVPRARILIRRCYAGGLQMVGAPESRLHLPIDIVRESAKLVYQETVQRHC